jgi:NAD(P)-dependent dehydrogenase (short-subunit alcohol dehydrogenase family)
MTWSTADIPDLTGRRALVTGATSGIGYETALELLRHGADVVIAARNHEKAAQAAENIKQAVGKVPAVVELDLADLASVAKAADEVTKEADRLDLLVNNAGVMAPPYRQTPDGFELQVGTKPPGSSQHSPYRDSDTAVALWLPSGNPNAGGHQCADSLPPSQLP